MVRERVGCALPDTAAVQTSLLVEQLDVTPASAMARLQRLAKLHLVPYTPYKGVVLTAPGRRVALVGPGDHRLLEFFLVEPLGYSWAGPGRG